MTWNFVAVIAAARLRWSRGHMVGAMIPLVMLQSRAARTTQNPPFVVPLQNKIPISQDIRDQYAGGMHWRPSSDLYSASEPLATFICKNMLRQYPS